MKIKKYAQFLSAEELENFYPFVLDGAGNIGRRAEDFLERLASRLPDTGTAFKTQVQTAIYSAYWEWFSHFSRRYNSSLSAPVGGAEGHA